MFHERAKHECFPPLEKPDRRASKNGTPPRRLQRRRRRCGRLLPLATCFSFVLDRSRTLCVCACLILQASRNACSSIEINALSLWALQRLVAAFYFLQATKATTTTNAAKVQNNNNNSRRIFPFARSLPRSFFAFLNEFQYKQQAYIYTIL